MRRTGPVVVFWVSACAGTAALVCGAVNHELGVVVLGSFLVWVALAHAALVILTAVPRRSTCFRLLCGVVEHAHPGDSDLCLDIDATQVMGVFSVGPELLACLHGGAGFRCDPGAGEHRSCQIDEVAIAWRCTGRRAARKLARQLNAWQVARTPLRLLSARGRCAVLMEDERIWLALPEIRARV
jgi:hypothetical protein